MKKMIVMAIVMVAIVACSGGNKKSTADSKASASIDGAKIYKSNCMLCHGDDGKLGLNNSKDLTVSKLTKEERIDIITNGKNTMVGFSSLLDEDEIKAVADYTFTLK
jgi:cytochrome c6